MEINEDIIYFWLSVSGISSRRVNRLIELYTPIELYEQIGHTLTDAQLFGEKQYAALLRNRNDEFLTRAVDKLYDMGISFITRNKFPERLAQSEVDPPVMLYYRGDIRLMKSDCVAVVGTRACSSYGKEVATRLSSDLCANGVTIVSGLATGIDTYAHRAAVKAGGKTIAVLGSGLNCITPVGNVSLYDDILSSGGLVVSEYAPGVAATKYTFPERNRIISGLSLGVVVVEAGIKSGALITAEFAEEQNRTVFAVPGNITSSKSLGSNRLLLDGATPALSADDICDCLQLSFGKSDKKLRAIQLDIFEQKLYNILLTGEASFDTLVEQSGIAPPRLSAILSAMEIKGIICKKQSNIFYLA